ncbi:hypothetical protein AAHA92_21071 [Salvia divinorum]|uniref:Uncharacterized protein n=1 Tax=Salvia divinorum TaxID=28513 RepID=A0ABD1GJL7_SALDI
MTSPEHVAYRKWLRSHPNPFLRTTHPSDHPSTLPEYIILKTLNTLNSTGSSNHCVGARHNFQIPLDQDG